MAETLEVEDFEGKTKKFRYNNASGIIAIVLLLVLAVGVPTIFLRDPSYVYTFYASFLSSWLAVFTIPLMVIILLVLQKRKEAPLSEELQEEASNLASEFIVMFSSHKLQAVMITGSVLLALFFLWIGGVFSIIPPPSAVSFSTTQNDVFKIFMEQTFIVALTENLVFIGFLSLLFAFLFRASDKNPSVGLLTGIATSVMVISIFGVYLGLFLEAIIIGGFVLAIAIVAAYTNSLLINQLAGGEIAVATFVIFHALNGWGIGAYLFSWMIFNLWMLFAVIGKSFFAGWIHHSVHNTFITIFGQIARGTVMTIGGIPL